MVIKDIQGKVISTVQYISPNSSIESLGHYKELNGSQTKHSSSLQKLIHEWTVYLATCHLPTSLVYQYCISILFTKATYLPSILLFFLQKITKNAKIFLLHITPRFGIQQKHTHWYLIRFFYSCGCWTGVLYLEQGFIYLHQFIQHWRSNTKISALLLITIVWCQLNLRTTKTTFWQHGTRFAILWIEMDQKYTIFPTTY